MFETTSEQELKVVGSYVVVWPLTAERYKYWIDRRLSRAPNDKLLHVSFHRINEKRNLAKQARGA